ncbi:hypothetical protein HYPGJ_20682 [Hyphomicrobium sp. GJ21]|nr:hypothetical protein HYPGJ_20682 [Hyphomicrobium sp. GJ21]
MNCPLGHDSLAAGRRAEVLDEEITQVRRPSLKDCAWPGPGRLAGSAKSCISALSAPVGG